MRVKLLVGLSGPAITLNPGDEHDFPDDEAMRFVRAGFATPVPAPVETATIKPVAEKRRKHKGVE